MSAGVGDHPCFFAFITMTPIDCKINNFPYFSFFAFLRIAIIIFWRTPNYYSADNPLTSMLRIHSFSAHYAAF